MCYHVARARRYFGDGFPKLRLTALQFDCLVEAPPSAPNVTTTITTTTTTTNDDKNNNNIINNDIAYVKFTLKP